MWDTQTNEPTTHCDYEMVLSYLLNEERCLTATASTAARSPHRCCGVVCLKDGNEGGEGALRASWAGANMLGGRGTKEGNLKIYLTLFNATCSVSSSVEFVP